MILRSLQRRGVSYSNTCEVSMRYDSDAPSQMPNLRLKSSHNVKTNYSSSTSSHFSAESLHRRASMASKKHPQLMARTPLQHYHSLITETTTFKLSTSAHMTVLSIHSSEPPADLSRSLAVSQSITRSVKSSLARPLRLSNQDHHENTTPH